VYICIGAVDCTSYVGYVYGGGDVSNEIDSPKILIKSKERVQKHGEVFTPQHIVKDMLNLLPKEIWENVGKTFLEPACGEGAFLTKIYEKKLERVDKISNDFTDWEYNAFRATASIYGIELLEDNLQICKEKLNSIFLKFYEKASKKYNAIANDKTIEGINFLIDCNIVQKNFLKDDIILSEWDFGYVQRKESHLRKNMQADIFAAAKLKKHQPQHWRKIQSAIN
jgi:type I restriction-modification system DNA methylase subunit